MNTRLQSWKWLTMSLAKDLENTVLWVSLLTSKDLENMVYIVSQSINMREFEDYGIVAKDLENYVRMGPYLKQRKLWSVDYRNV